MNLRAFGHISLSELGKQHFIIKTILKVFGTDYFYI